MLTDTAALEIHDRTHACLKKLLEYLAGFDHDELNRRLEGFGYSTILEQLHHAIGAERYWMGVLRGELLVDEDERDRASIAALESFRARVAGDTQTQLLSTSSHELDHVREVTTWGNKQKDIKPSWVFLRTQSHIFHHTGQITAMARLLGRPVPAGLDFPLI